MALDDDLKSDNQNARGAVAANLSRKKATPPQPAKKLLIKLRTVPYSSILSFFLLRILYNSGVMNGLFYLC
ncbi:hypothetical protein S83_041341 [Arachis hypogaea]